MSFLRLVMPSLTFLTGAAVYACGDGNRSDAFVIDDQTLDSGKRDSGYTTTDSSVPVKDGGLGIVLPPSSIALGEGFSCLVAKDRAVYCWGRNDSGQLGSDPAKTPSCGSFPCTPVPTKVEGLPARIATVRAGKNFACALDEADQVWCWGNNTKGQLLAKDVTTRFTPERVAAGVAQLEAAGEHVCFLSDEGFVSCWGDNACDLFGRPNTPIIGVSKVPGLPAQVQISLGVDEMCTVALDSSVLCWGTDHKGSLGHPLPSNPATCNGLPFDPVPKRVAQDAVGVTFVGAADVHVGLGLVCVHMSEDNKVMCWGDNSHGGLGQGIPDNDTHRNPVAVPAIATTTLRVGGETGCAVVADRLICWGDARYGQLDSLGADTANCAGSNCRPLGYVVPNQQPLKAIGVSSSNLATIKGDNSLWLWGKNDSAEVGAASSETGNVSCAGGSKCIPSPRMLTTAPSLE